MNVNEVIELEIESNGMNGEGVAHCDGKVVFVPYTLKGEHVRAVVKQVKKKYA
ncbi:MAG: TRAM domain-containing protein, partial [Clostridiales bacterium]|nr:TRAM domain-containing protein [Clostridiales bacterium]